MNLLNLFSNTVIIGIHGLENKPPKTLHRIWWLAAIKEGLRNIGHPHLFINFELVYWADCFYAPLNPKITDPKNPRYLSDPYVPGKKGKKKIRAQWMKRKILDLLDKKLDQVFLSEKSLIDFDSISDFILRRMFHDLSVYYGLKHEGKIGRKNARKLLTGLLFEALKKYQGKRILLIAHSMGSIIAYDTLSGSEKEISIESLMTLGSPMGLPIIVKRILAEKKDLELKAPRAPENITGCWLNLSDLDDKIAMDYILADDYSPNSRGLIAEDYVVCNDYEYEGKKNPHKIYGYLRTPEAAEAIHNFLAAGKSRLRVYLMEILARLFSIGIK